VLGTERFLREIRLTANLPHPHILSLIDSGEAAGQFVYVMPYVEGESLRQRLQREGQLSIDEALRLTREVAEALDYAHQQGIIHRDIKPENILLSRGHALVADFGIALAVSSAGRERLTETGLSLGTPAYMSPEQATADPKLDGRSDQYSLACVLYEMLAGEPPGPEPGCCALEPPCSSARTLATRRSWRSSRVWRAARKTSTSSRARAAPMTRRPSTRTSMSSCSTPWCAE
jgi:serine/threonine-protein kinase